MTVAVDIKTGAVVGQVVIARDDQPTGTVRVLTCGKGIYMAHYADILRASVRLAKPS